MMTIGVLPPCPPPSWATARVVTVDVMTRRVTIAYLMLIAPRSQWMYGAGDVISRSFGNFASWLP
jgi:hypothetical protein